MSHIVCVDLFSFITKNITMYTNIFWYYFHTKSNSSHYDHKQTVIQYSASAGYAH